MIRGLGGPAGGNDGGEPIDCKTRVKMMWDQVPTFCRFVFWTLIAIYLSSWLTMAPMAYMICVPSYTILKFQIWRAVTGTFVAMDLLMLLFTLLSWLPTACQMEKQEGTVKMCARVLTLGTLINLLFAIVCSLVGIQQYSMGLWPLVFTDMVIECMRSPEVARNLCCCPIQIKGKYYPPVILLLFSIFFGPQIALFFGLVIGYVQVWGYLDRLEISITRATTWESKFPFKYFKEKPHFVTVSDAMGGQVTLPTFMMRQPGNPTSNNSTASSSQGNNSSNSQSKQEKGGFQAFKGKGVSLGSATTASQSFGSIKSKSSSTAPSSQQQRNVAQVSKLMQLNQNKVNDADESVGHDMHVKSEQTKHTINNQSAEYTAVAKTTNESSSDEDDAV